MLVTSGSRRRTPEWCGYHVAIEDFSRLHLHGELHPMHSVARGALRGLWLVNDPLLKPGMTRHDVAYL
jgi:hypothetical protein